MEEKKFSKVATFENSTKWEQSISRRRGIYKRDNDIRSDFLRDYNRILHCMAYRRLKHKTQVFFATGNDHICTRIEHVNHVSSVSYTIANFLGLNTELTAAIAIGHDLGHAPFGHEGEKIIGRYVTDKLKSKFWHEKNSLRFVDCIETLTDPDGKEQNLNLTYAVRDGIICHCGEVKSTAIYPREDNIDLNDIQEAGQVSPFTWEGCIVKIADKISYLGRDIEDAFTLQILNMNQLRELHSIIKNTLGVSNIREINNTVLMHNFMIDLCQNSNPEKGIVFSNKYLEFIEMVKDFNYKNIYYHKRLRNFKKYAELVLNTIIETLEDFYDAENTILNIKKNINIYPVLTDTFFCWLYKYCLNIEDNNRKLQNEKIYDLRDKSSYIQAIVDFISGMTDSFAIKVFNEIIKL
jgi:dGTPase